MVLNVTPSSTLDKERGMGFLPRAIWKFGTFPYNAGSGATDS